MSNRIQNRPKKSADQLIFILWLVLIIWIPLPHGAVQPWAFGLMEIWIILLSMAWLLLFARGHVQFNRPFLQAAPLFMLLAGCLILLALQLTLLPVDLLSFLSPKSADTQHRLLPLMNGQSTATLSLHIHAGWEYLLKSTAYTLFLALSLLLLDRSSRIRTLIHVVVICGVFQAVYGGLASLHGSKVAVGTFVNRNHLGGYLEMCLAVGIGLLIAEAKDTLMVNWQHRLISLLKWMASPKLLLRLALALMVVTLVLTRSRGSNSAFFISLLITSAGWIFITRKHPSTLALAMIISIFVIDILILGEWFGLEKVVQRIQQTTIASEGRVDIYTEAVAYLKDFPILGSGAGSFPTIFPGYRQQESVGGGVAYMHAHNDYLEIALENGIIGLILLGSVPILALISAWRAMARPENALLKGLGFGAFMGITSILYHSATDFNLQIPSNALLFILLIGLSYVGANHPSRRNSRSTATT